MPNLPTPFFTWIASLFKQKDTMGHDSWTILLRRTFVATTDITLNLYISAAEKFADPQAFLDSFVVVWIWEFKKGSPFHEFYIIEAEDRMQGNKLTKFVLERITKKSTTEDIKVQPLRVPPNWIILIVSFRMLLANESYHHRHRHQHPTLMLQFRLLNWHQEIVQVWPSLKVLHRYRIHLTNTPPKPWISF